MIHGIVQTFPWMPFSSLANNYIDHHFLYHVFLFPFVNYIGPFVGSKLATMIIGSSALTVFYVVIRSFRFRAPLFFTSLLAISPSFMFRLSLAKVPGFSIIFILLGLYYLVHKKPVALGIVAFLYVWAYDAWPLLPFIVLLWTITKVLLAPTLRHEPLSVLSYLRLLFSAEYIKPVIGVVTGTLVGIVVNPYFPANLQFYWLHIIKIGLINYQSKIGVGAEWYPADFFYLLQSQTVIFFICLVAIVLFLLRAREVVQKKETVRHEELLNVFASFIVAGFFLVMTIKSRRNVDYFVPLATIALGSLVTISWRVVPGLINHARYLLKSYTRWLLILPVALFLVSIVFVQTQSFIGHRRRLLEGYSPTAYQASTTWLKNHLPAKAIIFHTNWDTFPLLFYGNDSSYYIVGLDTTFLYDRDPERYELWQKMVYGEYVGDVVQKIHDTFQTETIFIDKNRNHDIFQQQVEASSKVKKTYEDDVSLIFTIDH